MSVSSAPAKVSQRILSKGGIEAIWGRMAELQPAPGLEHLQNATYVPMELGAGWGLFSAEHNLVASSVTAFGPDYHRIQPFDEHLIPRYRDMERLTGTYIYAGIIHNHYGHGLLSTFNRFWPWIAADFPREKILVHGQNPFSIPFMDYWLRSIGLRPESFVFLSAAAMIENVIVIEPSFVEQWAAHRLFYDLCRKVAMSNGANLIPVCGDVAYISKSKLTSGVQNIENENEVDDEMQRLGVRVVHPEQLSISDQIATFWQHPVVMGSTSSAMHTLLFGASGSRLLAYTNDSSLHGNYPLIDMISGARSQYFRADLVERPIQAGFQRTLAFRSPRKAVEAMVDRLPRGLIRMRGVRRLKRPKLDGRLLSR